MKTKYPTWIMETRNFYRTAEGCEGVPDCIIVRDGNRWCSTWRTSAHWETHKTVMGARKSFEEGRNQNECV